MSLVPIREVHTTAELFAHYRDVNQRLWTPQPPPQPPPRQPALPAPAGGIVARPPPPPAAAPPSPPVRDLPVLDFDALVRRVAERLQQTGRGLRPEDDQILRQIGVSSLVGVVERISAVGAADLYSQRRDKSSVKARHIVMWLAKRFTVLSLPVIGRQLGGRDHTTVLHGQRRAQAVVNRIGPPEEETPPAWADHLWKADWGKRDSLGTNGCYWAIVRVDDEFVFNDEDAA